MTCAPSLPAVERKIGSPLIHPLSRRLAGDSSAPPRPSVHPSQENSGWPLSLQSRGAFNRIKHTSVFPANTVIFVEGQAAGGIFVLERGRAKLSTCSIEGRTMILRIADCGDLLGLHASITGAPHSTTVTTMETSTLAFVSRQNLLCFLKGHGDAALWLTQLLCRDCQQAYELLRVMGSSHSVCERLARFLLETAMRGEVRNGKARARLSLTHEDMAQLMGTSRETITRLFSEFRKKELVVLKGSMLTICDWAALEKLRGQS